MGHIGTVGDYAAAAFSGAVGAVSGGGLAAKAFDIVGSAVVKYSVDTLAGEPDKDTIMGNAAKNSAETGIINRVTKSVPKNVKAVKPIARQYGITNRNLKRFYRVSVAATKTFNWVKRNAVRIAFRIFG